MTTQKEVRAAFWEMYGKRREYRGKTQNQLPVDVRCAFVDFVDQLQRDGQISMELAEDVTL